MRLLTLLSAVVLSAAAESRPGPSCATAERHEFDFVLGNWLVRDAAGQLVGTTTVSKAYDGCVMLETWLGAGSAGVSLGVVGYVEGRGRWRRDFLERGGEVLTLEGGWDGAAMVMTGKSYGPDGVQEHRLSWTPARDGTVEQRWQTSADAGRSWQIRFKGVFHRISE